MYPGGHTVMYATPTPSLGDGSLTVLNTFPTPGHSSSHEPGTTGFHGYMTYSDAVVVCHGYLSFRVPPTGLPHISPPCCCSDPSVCRPAPPGN